METTRLNWSKPIIKETNYKDITQHIKAMARSLGPCTGIGGGGCSCSTACDPAKFYWNCSGHFWTIFG